MTGSGRFLEIMRPVMSGHLLMRPYEVLGLRLGRQVLGLGPQVLDNWLPHNNLLAAA